MDTYWVPTTESQVHVFAGIFVSPFPTESANKIQITTKNICKVAISPSLCIQWLFWLSLQCTVCHTLELTLNAERRWNRRSVRTAHRRLDLTPGELNLGLQVNHCHYCLSYHVQKIRRKPMKPVCTRLLLGTFERYHTVYSVPKSGGKYCSHLHLRGERISEMSLRQINSPSEGKLSYHLSSCLSC